MVLASFDQCRRNTAAASGWTWFASEAAKCGQVFGAVTSMFFYAIDYAPKHVTSCVENNRINSGLCMCEGWRRDQLTSQVS